MSHVLFAVFDDAAAAAEALERLHELGADKEGFSFIVHSRALDVRGNEELPLSETGAASAITKGAMLGALGGMIAGAILAGPLGLLGAGPLAGVLFGTTTGTAVGTIAGLIGGATEPDAILADLARGIEEGKIVVSVETSKLSNQDDAEALLLRHGAHVVQRRIVRLQP